jgi:hypothetical protein
MEALTMIMNNIALIMLVIGLAAFLVSVITEVTKGIGVMKKIPTDVQVIVLSIVVCLVAYLAYISYFNIEIQWYYIAGCFVIAFIVAFVAMYGWEKLNLLYKRFTKDKGDPDGTD